MTPPVIYIAHPKTGEFIGTSHADADPLDVENWLIPAFAYLDRPPKPAAGKTIIRTDGGWSVVPDLRGTVYRKNTGEPVQHDEPGELPDGLTKSPSPSPDHYWKSGTWVLNLDAQLARVGTEKGQLINQRCEAAIVCGFWSDALGERHQYSSHLDDQLNLTGAILRGADMPYACRNVQGVKAFHLHTSTQLRQVGDDFTLYKLQLLQRANELKQQLDLALAARDADTLKSITWEAAQP